MLRSTATENPPQGSYWKPVPHDELLGTILGVLTEWGCTTDHLTVHRSEDGEKMAVAWDVELPIGTRRTEVSLMLGVVNHNTGQQALRLYAGVTEGELSVPFDLYHLGRHVRGNHLANTVRSTLGVWEADVKTYPAILRGLRRQPVGAKAADHLLCCAGRMKAMPGSRLLVVDKLFREGERSAWGFLTAFARVARRNPPLSQLGQVYCCYRLLRGEDRALEGAE